MPFYARLWVMLLVIASFIIPLFYLDGLEAKVILATFLVSAFMMTVLTALSGFSRLLGLGHFLWFPLLYFLWTRLNSIPADDLFGNWLRLLMTLNAISLLIDVVDVGHYIAGDRKEIVDGL